MKNPPEFIDGQKWHLWIAGTLEKSRARASFQIEFPQALLREPAIAFESPCEACLSAGRSLHLNDGELCHFDAFCTAKQMEGPDGIRSDRDLAEWAWKETQTWEPFESAVSKASAAEELGDYEELLVAGSEALDALHLDPVETLRGRGGRRRAYEDWLEEGQKQGIAAPEGAANGRPRLFSSVLCPDRPTLRTCMEVLEPWLKHLWKRSDREDPVDHVKKVFRVTQRFCADYVQIWDYDALIRTRKGSEDAWKRRVAQEAAELQEASAYYFFPKLLALAEVAAPLIRTQWPEFGEDGWRRRRSAQAMELLARLSGGVFTRRQIYHELRAQRSTDS